MSLVSCFSLALARVRRRCRQRRPRRADGTPSWWTGMRTPLQLLVYGPDISACEVEVAGDCPGLSVAGTHRADSPNYLFVDVKVDPKAEPGTYYFIFSREGPSLSRSPMRSRHDAKGRANGRASPRPT